MIHFGHAHKQMLSHTAEVMGDRMHDEPDQWTNTDEATVDRIERMGKSPAGMLVITGDEMNLIDQRRLMAKVVNAELDHWVPDASQRLIWRASQVLNGTYGAVVLTDQPDCGAEPSWHALTADWVVGIYVRRCVTCGRLYRDGAKS
jgi:hypothetical protein